MIELKKIEEGHRMYTDSHNHTGRFSPDARMTIDELINTAKERSIPRVGITDHYEMDYPHKEDPLFTQLFDLKEYSETVDSWKTLSAGLGGPEILKGIEFGWQDHLTSEIDRISEEIDFDHVILSQHLFRGCDIYFSKEVYLLPRKERHREYIASMAKMAEDCSNYDIIAHYDYVNRYSDNKNETVWYKDCPGEFDRLFEAMITKGAALEINTSSIASQIRKGSKLIMPDEDVIRRYLAMGGRFISIGSDSHRCETLGNLIDETAEYLKSLGVNALTYYRQHTPCLEPLSAIEVGI